jgi:hypothetical protein
MKQDRLKPLETIEVSIRFWWVLTLMMIVGGGAGYFIYSITPPTYESHTVFSLLIDYTKTVKLTDVEADQANVTAGDVFLSTKVIDAVIKETAQHGINLSNEEFRRNAFVDRTNSEWTLRVRSPHAEIATELVNIWADQSLIIIREGLRHASLSSFYHRQTESLARCVEQVTSVEPSAPICGFSSVKELQQAVEKASALENTEANQSFGLLPGLTVTLLQRAETPGEIVGEGRSVFILAGLLLGFLGFLLFSGYFLSRYHKNRTA